MLKIEVLNIAGAGYTVIVDGLFSDQLGKDEALGVVAAALFSGASRIPYVKSYEEWARFNAMFGPKPHKPFVPAALLSWNGAARWK